MFLIFIFLLPLWFCGCAEASDDDSGSDDERVVLKKRKLASGAACIDRDPSQIRSSKVLDFIKHAGANGCSYQEIEQYVPNAYKRGPHNILELVVDGMFKNNVDIAFDEKENKYWYKGEAPSSPEGLPDVRLEIAEHIIQHHYEQNSMYQGLFAYRLFQCGYRKDRIEGYRFFQKMYYAVGVFCEYCQTETQKTVAEFLAYARDPVRAGLDFKRVVRRFESHKANELKEPYELSKNARSQARYAWLIPENVRVQIKDMARKTEAMCIACEEVMFCSWLQAPPENPLNTSRPAGKHEALALAELMRDQLNVDFKQVDFLDDEVRKKMGLSKEIVYWAVRVLCYDSPSRFHREVHGFLAFVNSHVWSEKTTFAQKKAAFSEKFLGDFCERVWPTAEYILTLPPDVFCALKSIKLLPPMPKESQRMTAAFGVMDFSEKVAEYAKKGKTCSAQELARFLPNKRVKDLDVLPKLFDVTFKKRIMVGCGNFPELRLYEGIKAPQPPVPIEVVIAARFFGVDCDAKEKVLFANILYQMGYPLQSYQQYCSIFDAVCVCIGTTVQDAPSVAKVQQCFSGIRHCLGVQFAKESINDIKFPSYLTDDEKHMVKNALFLAQTQILPDWGVHARSVNNSGKVSGGALQKDAVIARILKVYAARKKTCHYKVFQMVLWECCSAEDVLGAVMSAVMKSHLYIQYNIKCATYELLDTRLRQKIPEKPLGSFICERIAQSAQLGDAFLAYLLHEAGYYVSSYAEVHHLRIFYQGLMSLERRELLQRVQPFIRYVIDRKEEPQDIDHLFVEYLRLFPWASIEPDRDFAESLVTLLFSEKLSLSEVASLFVDRREKQKVYKDYWGGGI